MKFINVDGMAFIGPGSEWFWTALSGMILAITFMAIWRQLRLQRAATGYSQLTDLSRQDQAEPMLRMKLEILSSLRDGIDPAHVPYGAASYLTDFWEDTAALVREGHLDRRLLHMTIGNGCRRWWALLAPFIERVRAETGNARAAEHFEWLAGTMAEFDRRDADTTRYDMEAIKPGLNDLIRNQADRLRVAEELRAIVVRPMAPTALETHVPVATLKS